jgi:hypothetical protein
MIEPSSGDLDTFLRRWARRLRWVESLEWGPWGAAVGLALTGLAALAARLWPILMARQLAAMAGILLSVGAAGALTVVWLRPRTTLRLARIFDRRLSLAERLSTAVEIETGRLRAEAGMADAQLANTIHAAQRVDYQSLLPLRLPRWALLTTGVLALVLVCALVLPNPQESVLLQREAIRTAIEEQIEDLEEVKEQVAEAEGLTEAEREALLDELEEAIENLKEGWEKPEEALAALSEAEQELAKLQDPDAAGLEEGLQQAGEQVSDSELTKDLAEALAEGEYGEAAEALESLGDEIGESLTVEEELELARQLAEAAEALAEADPELAEALAEAAKAIEADNPDDAREALKAAAQEMGEAGERVERQEAVEGALTELQEGRAEIAKASGTVPGATNRSGPGGTQGRSGGQQPGSGQQPKPGHSEDSGSGKPYDEKYDPERIGEEGEGVNIGREGEGGVTVGDVSIPSPEGGRSNVPYREVYGDYAEEAGAALEGSYIPLGMKQYVRDYFSSLEP